MNPMLQQRYAQMQRMATPQPNVDMENYNAFNKLGGAVFNNGTGAAKDNRYGDVDLTDYRNDDNKNMSDKELYNSVFRSPNHEGAVNYYNNAMGGTYADQFKAMHPEMNTAGSIGPLNQAINNFNYDPNQFINNLGWKPSKMGVTKYGF